MSALRDSLAGLRAVAANPDVRRLQLGYAGSSIGQWAASTAVVVYVFEAGGAGVVALSLALRMIPAALAAPLMGALADRYPRRRVMVASDCSRAVVVACVAVLIAVDAPLAVVIGVSALTAVLSTAFEPAKAAILPGLVRRPEELSAANVVASMIDSTSLLIGPALAGLLLAVTSVPVVLCFTVAGLLWSAILIGRIHEPARAPRNAAAGSPNLLRDAADGIRAVAGHPGVRLLVVLLAAQIAVDGALGVLSVAAAIDLLDMGESGLGVLNAASGAGALIGAGVAVFLVGRRRLAGPLALGMLLWGLPLVVLGVLPAVGVAVAMLALVGLGNTLLDVSAFTLLQRVAPEEVLGRVFGVFESLALLSVTAGALVSAPLISIAGIEVALIAAGLFLPVVVAFSWAKLMRVDAAAALQARAPELALLRGIDMFAPLPAATLEGLVQSLERRTIMAGQDVMRQGEPGDSFLVLASGKAEVLVDDRQIRIHEPGDGFGEIALLNDSPRTATVRALTDAEVLELPREPFLAAVTGHLRSREAADAVVGARLSFARPALAG